MNYAKINGKVYEKLQKFSLGNWALWFLGVWTFLEAGFWFIAPDFIIFALCFFAPKRYKKFLLVSLVVSLIGGGCYYVFVHNNPELALTILSQTPFLTEKSMAFVSNSLGKGVIYTLLQSFTFIQFKAWTYYANAHNLNLVVYLFLVGISRIIRFSVVAGIAILLSRINKKFLRKHIIALIIGYVIFIFSFLFYFET